MQTTMKEDVTEAIIKEAAASSQIVDALHDKNSIIAKALSSTTHVGHEAGAKSTHIGQVSHLVAGGIAGAVSKTCTAPLARLTILFQVEGIFQSQTSPCLSRPSIIGEAYRITKQEGLKAFWKGNGVTVVHRFPYTAITFFSYEQYKAALLQRDATESHMQLGMERKVLAGAMAGITAASLTYPLDLVRTRLSAQRTEKYYNGILHALRTISRDGGPRGLYKGLGATLLGVAPNVAMSIPVYEKLKSTWIKRFPNMQETWSSLVVGSVSGIATSSVIYPFDLVRRRIQVEGVSQRAMGQKGSSALDMFLHVAKSQGCRGFYRGILPEYLKVVPSAGIMFMTYDLVKRHLPTQ